MFAGRRRQPRTPDRERGSLLARPFPAALFLLAAAILAAAAGLAWSRAARDRANLVTDGAQWIWLMLDLGEREPLRFWAMREFSLEAVPAAARALLFVDPRGSLTINGSRFPPGEQRPGSPLRILDVAPALVAGTNRVVIEAESPTGAGGILFCLDLPGGRKIVSDSSWRVARSEAALSAGGGRRAAVWGRPPMYPWGYPRAGRTDDRGLRTED